MPAEFGYMFRDWMKKHEKQENIAFAVLDFSYADGSNYALARKFGFSINDAPTFFALDKPSTGNFYKQDKKYNLTNFEEISEDFKRDNE